MTCPVRQGDVERPFLVGTTTPEKGDVKHLSMVVVGETLTDSPPRPRVNSAVEKVNSQNLIKSSPAGQCL